jgi:hypothetical protein
MNILFAAVCFLFIFCGHGHRHHHVKHVPALKCTDVTSDFDDFRYSWHQGYGTDVHRDEFVKKYPAAQQRTVLKCIDKAG